MIKLIWQIITAKKYVHLKSGNIYYRLFECVGTEDQVVYTVYYRANRFYARPTKMFHEKFKERTWNLRDILRFRSTIKTEI